MAVNSFVGNSAPTEINRAGYSAKTEINRSNVSASIDKNREFAAPGEVILDKYEIMDKLGVESGESILYLCKSEDKRYVAKIYCDTSPTDETVLERLGKIDSPYVAQIIESGVFKGLPVEITEFFQNGSLQKLKGRINDNSAMIKRIVSDLNEGLHSLHEAGIIHKDLKPSNIMISDDGKDAVIIDFGISLYVSKEERAVNASSDDLTPEFSAPETFDGIFWEGSDYYSLGMTLLWLAAGETPYEDDSREEIKKKALLYDIRIPQNISNSLAGLIKGLTYLDIKNRNNRDDLNNRWTYEEVKKWLKGMPNPVPPVREGAYTKFPRFVFNEKEYTSLEHLILGMNRYWEKAKEIVLDGSLAKHLHMSNPDISKALEDTVRDSKGKDDDMILFTALYKMNPGMKWFLWKGHTINGHIIRDLYALGMALMDAFRDGGGFRSPTLTEIIEKSVISEYIALTLGTGAPEYSALKSCEDRIATAQNEWELQYGMFILAYQLTGDKTIVYRRKIRPRRDGDELTAIPSDIVFRTTMDIIRYLQHVADSENENEFDRFVDFLGLENENGKFGPQFQAWIFKYNSTKVANIRKSINNCLK